MTANTRKRNLLARFERALALVVSCVVLAGLTGMIVGCTDSDSLLESAADTINTASDGEVSQDSGENDASLVYADFSNPTILTANMVIYGGKGFKYNSFYGNSWLINYQYGSFQGTFTVPNDGLYDLAVTHLTSASSLATNGGYSPVWISVNYSAAVSDYDPASYHSYTHDWVTDTWTITAHAGTNNIAWSAGPLQTNYWIHRIEITPHQY